MIRKASSVIIRSSLPSTESETSISKRKLSSAIQAGLLGLSLVLPLSAQDMVYDTVLSFGDSIQGGAETFSSTISIGWNGEQLGLATRDTKNRGYLSFWNSLDGIGYVAGPNWPFPGFTANSPPNNREGNPPVSPVIGVGASFLSTHGNFAFSATVNDAATVLVEPWTAFLSVAGGEFIQWAQPIAGTPIAAAPLDEGVYFTDLGNVDQDGWLFSNGDSQIIFHAGNQIPPALEEEGATFFFPGTPFAILEDRTLFFDASYNIPGSSVRVLLKVGPEGGVTILAGEHTLPPLIPDGLLQGDTWTIERPSANESGAVVFYSFIRTIGVFIRDTIWTVSSTGGAPALLISTEVAYPIGEDSTVIFDGLGTARIDSEENVLFEAEVVGESGFSVWRRRWLTGSLERVSPADGSPMPGFPDAPLRTANIVDMNPSGRTVLRMQGNETSPLRAIDGYYLETPNGSFQPAAVQGQPLQPEGGLVTVLNVELSDLNQLAMNLLIDSKSSVVVARDPRDIVPEGDIYIWDGGAGTTKWNTVTNGRSNWLDVFGTRWDKPPNSISAQVEIGDEFVVELVDQAVNVNTVAIGESSLEISVSLQCEGFVSGGPLSSIILKSGSLNGEGNLVTSGIVIKEGPGVFFLAMKNVLIDDADFTLEDGILNLWSDTVLENAPFNIEGGTLIALGNFKFRGESGLIKISSAADKIEFSSEPEFTFETDTTFEIEEGAVVTIGDASGEQSLALNFDVTSEEEFRVLRFTGGGQVQFHDGFTVGEKGILRNSAGTSSVPGLVFDTDSSSPGAEEVIVDGLLENLGSMEITTGGITGDFRNKGTLLITNNVGANLPILLDCENQGTIIQDGGFLYQNFVAKPDSRHILSQSPGTFGTIGPFSVGVEESIIRFEKGSALVAENRQTTIEFASIDEPNFEADIEVKGSGELVIKKANTGPATTIEVESGGILKIDELNFDLLSIKGEGFTELTGDILPVSDNAKLNIGTESFSVESAKLIGTQLPQSPRLPDAPYQFAPLSTPTQSGSLENVQVESGAFIGSSPQSVITVKKPITLGEQIIIAGKWILEDDILIHPLSPQGAFIFIGELNDGGTIQVAPDTTNPITIEPFVFFSGSGDKNIIVGESSRLIFRSPPGASDNFIQNGFWKIEDFASCALNDNGNPSDVGSIGVGASVELGKPNPVHNSLGNLPNLSSELLIAGKLTLENTTLDMAGNPLTISGTLTLVNSIVDMDGNTMRSSGTVDYQGDSKVIGNIKSVRGEVGGTVLLAGNLNIDGSLETDGVIALGASPGSGLITGDLTLLPGSDMRVEFAGAEPGSEFDFLEVGGTANLDGKLTLSLIDEYFPDAGSIFLFLKAGALAGDFSEIDQNEMGRKRRFDVASGPEGLTATAEVISIAIYAGWRAAFFSESEVADDSISGPEADPDLDGVTNLAEYISSSIPKRFSPNPLALAETSPEGFVIQIASGVTDYLWRLESSPDLIDWAPIETELTEISSAEDFSIFGVALQNPSTEDSRFYRLGIDLIQP